MTTLSDVPGLDIMDSNAYNLTYNNVKTVAHEMLAFKGTMAWKGKQHRDFVDAFGIDLHVAVALWVLLRVHAYLPSLRIKHMFWALSFLKTYGITSVLARQAGTTRDTYTKWVWLVIDELASLDDLLVSYLHLH